nr:MAG TPA: hypothetical protein [Caudoviricetes sp.]
MCQGVVFYFKMPDSSRFISERTCFFEILINML